MLKESTSRDYQAISDMPQIQPGSSPVFWKKFFVVLSGKTNNTHGDIVQMIKNSGHIEVNTPEDCDYCLLFCPITSRVGTEVESSLRLLPAEKPAILVVMYHTYDSNYVTPENHRLGVEDPRVHLTVSCLFHEQRLLRCNRNDITRFELQRFLRFQQESWSILQYMIRPLFWVFILAPAWLFCLAKRCCLTPARPYCCCLTPAWLCYLAKRCCLAPARWFMWLATIVISSVRNLYNYIIGF